MRRAKPTKTKKFAIRALSIQQPLAELILRKKKRHEIRSWSTNHRGPFLIHTSLKVDSVCGEDEGIDPKKLPRGAFVGVVMLVDVQPFTRKHLRGLPCAGWSPNYFAWELKNPLRLARPIKAKGRLGLFSVSISVAKRVQPYIRKLEAASRKAKSAH